MHTDTFREIIKRIVPMADEIRELIGPDNRINLVIDDSGRINVRLFEKLNDGHYESLRAEYIPPVGYQINIDEIKEPIEDI